MVSIVMFRISIFVFCTGSISDYTYIRQRPIVTSSRASQGATYFMTNIKGQKISCENSGSNCHRNLLPCANQVRQHFILVTTEKPVSRGMEGPEVVEPQLLTANIIEGIRRYLV